MYAVQTFHTTLRKAKMRRFKIFTRYLLGTLFVLAGINHFANAPIYVSVMPPYLPWHLELVISVVPLKSLSASCSGLGALQLGPRGDSSRCVSL